jgi:hypothetical protein
MLAPVNLIGRYLIWQGSAATARLAAAFVKRKRPAPMKALAGVAIQNWLMFSLMTTNAVGSAASMVIRCWRPNCVLSRFALQYEPTR